MAGNVAELRTRFKEKTDVTAKAVGAMWDDWNNQRRSKIEEWKELRDFIFAVDTSKTTVGELGWKNSTTYPKLCQIRDNIMANYNSTLFPNRNWISWIGDTEEDEAKAKVIEAFIRSITDRSGFYETMSQLLLDYIDYGMPFATVAYVKEILPTPDGSDEIRVGYEGPKVIRISPYDIVFNPLSRSFEDSPKIIRDLMTIGELEVLALNPDTEFFKEALARSKELRASYGGMRKEDLDKAAGISIDGFGDFQSYLASKYVEVLEFIGDYYDDATNVLYQNVRIVVIDRCITAYFDHSDKWAGKNIIVSCPWRRRPDNLYGMGPLDNLVGMQYRIDHLENLKADAMDLIVHPPIAVYGDVEPFTWQPNEVISIPNADGKVETLSGSLNGVLVANNEIERLEAKMEEFAGAPKNTMGIRTPGEKTAFEVQTLEASAGRIFQEKISQFEREVLEPILNLMLSYGRQYMKTPQQLRVFNSQFDADEFLSIKPEDLNGNGTLRPIGARHFAEKANTVQNLTQIMNTNLGSIISAHISSEGLAKTVEGLLDLEQYKIVRKNVGITEKVEQESFAQELQEAQMDQMATGVEAQ